VVAQVLETGSRIALIGCGGLGMLIAHELKQHGIIAIVLGGALQVLFGIKGNRWKNHAVISQLWNEDWVYPLEEETPRGAEEIEGGCYWGKN
jgi:glycine/D-amino acid oxidase-like deaminating enzyme